MFEVITIATNESIVKRGFLQFTADFTHPAAIAS